MATYQDVDIAIWACRQGNSSDVVEFPLGREPIDQACASHGEAFIKRCPNKKCPAPTYHRIDLDRKFHHCGEKIPWAESRAETARVMMEHDPFNSKFVGRPKPERGMLESLLDTTFRGADQREITPQERQDLITPPSGRLPAERVRPKPVSRQAEGQDAPLETQKWLDRATGSEEKEPPRVTPSRGSGSKLSQPDLRPENAEGAIPEEFTRKPRDMSRFIDRDAMKLMDEIGRNQAKAARPKGRLARAVPSRSAWSRFWGGTGAFFFGSLQNTVGTVLGAVIIVVIAAVCGVKLVVQ